MEVGAISLSIQVLRGIGPGVDVSATVQRHPNEFYSRIGQSIRPGEPLDICSMDLAHRRGSRRINCVTFVVASAVSLQRLDGLFVKFRCKHYK